MVVLTNDTTDSFLVILDWLGQNTWLLWPTEYDRSGIIPVQDLAFRRTSSSILISWRLEPPCRKSNYHKNFPGGASGKESACNAGYSLGGESGCRRCPGEENGIPLDCSCLGNPRDRGAWPATAHGVTKGQTGLNSHRASCCDKALENERSRPVKEESVCFASYHKFMWVNVKLSLRVFRFFVRA